MSKYKPYSLMVTVSLPRKTAIRYLPNLVATDFGYHLTGDYDLLGYRIWLTRQFKAYLTQK